MFKIWQNKHWKDTHTHTCFHAHTHVHSNAWKIFAPIATHIGQGKVATKKDP